MAWLNYHHLYYFWSVARLGTIAAAAEQLHLASPTLSTQLKALEASLGHTLFERQGRRLRLTEMGQLVFRYAEDIFRLGQELQQAVEGRAPGEQVRLQVGVVDVIPKLVAERLLEPAVEQVPGLRLECREGPLPQLVGALAAHQLDVVLSDTPLAAPLRVRAFSHLLGECGVSFLAAPALASLRRGFPGSLLGAPALLPQRGTTLRLSLDAWFEAHACPPEVRGEFEDGALLQAFGQRGLGFFAVPSVIEKEVCQQYGVGVLGRAEDLRERFYALTVERRLRHPALAAMAQTARNRLFG